MTLNYLQHIAKYQTELPHLAASFESMLDVPAPQRLGHAKQTLKTVFRDGWFVNTPVGKKGDAETVWGHIEHLKELIEGYFPAQYKSLAVDYADCHDDQESVAHALINGVKRDLNPRFNTQHYAISEGDKEQIENFAADIIFEAEPERKELWAQYRSSKDEATKLFVGLDKVCVMWRCVDFVESGKYNYTNFQPYWDYWTPENAQKKLPDFVSNFYINELWPKAEKLKLHS